MEPVSEDLAQRATEYLDTRGMRLGPRLGFGKDGTVFSTVGTDRGATAVKMLVRADLFQRELAAYRRLTECGLAGTDRIFGHNIPSLIDHDSTLMIIEVSIVARPFILDFAGAYLDSAAPEFDDETWAITLAHWQDRAGTNWPRVRTILFAFSRLGIDLLDPSPANIGFVDE